MTGKGIGKALRFPLQNGSLAPAASTAFFTLPGSGISFELNTSLHGCCIFMVCVRESGFIGCLLRFIGCFCPHNVRKSSQTLQR